MLDNLAIIRSAIEEHHTIRGSIKLVGDSVNDLEAIFSLQKIYSGWTQSSMEDLADKQKKVQQTMSLLEEGLKNHFGFEEKALPPLVGEPVMQALLLEHREIKKKIGEAKSVASDTRLEGLSREELLARKSHIQQAINNICQMVEEHATREEIILRMIARVLEERKQSKG